MFALPDPRACPALSDGDSVTLVPNVQPPATGEPLGLVPPADPGPRGSTAEPGRLPVGLAGDAPAAGLCCCSSCVVGTSGCPLLLGNNDARFPTFSLPVFTDEGSDTALLGSITPLLRGTETDEPRDGPAAAAVADGPALRPASGSLCCAYSAKGLPCRKWRGEGGVMELASTGPYAVVGALDREGCSCV